MTLTLFFTGLVYGHTGHVRFLASVEVPLMSQKPSGQSNNGSDSMKQRTSSTGSMVTTPTSASSVSSASSGLGPHLTQAATATSSSSSSSSLHRHMTSSSSSSVSLPAKVMVISGGDGYEDFRNTAPTESAGKDDSTNHLLLWQV